MGDTRGLDQLREDARLATAHVVRLPMYSRMPMNRIICTFAEVGTASHCSGGEPAALSIAWVISSGCPGLASGHGQ